MKVVNKMCIFKKWQHGWLSFASICLLLSSHIYIFWGPVYCVDRWAIPRYFFSTGTVGTLEKTLEKSTGTAVPVLLFLNFRRYSVLLQNLL